MRTSDAASLRKKLLLAAGAVTALAVHGGSRAEAAGEAKTETVCIPKETSGACPSDEDALQRIYEQDPERCPQYLEQPGATVFNGQCCYEVRFDCSVQVVGCSVSGRPLLVEERPVAAVVGRVLGWQESGLGRPDVAGLSPVERRIAALHWARIGAAEYASIAGFQRFAMDLMANGAPPELIAGASRAALDELRHARLAFTIASAFAGSPVGPAEIDLPAAVPIHRTMGELAAATAREGCTVETLSACLLAEAREHATDPAIRAALVRMLRDEERHSALAWKTLRWAVSREPEIASGVREALDRATRGLSVEGFSSEAGLERFGLLRPEDARGCLRTAVREMIEPCRDAIFGASMGAVA